MTNDQSKTEGRNRIESSDLLAAAVQWLKDTHNEKVNETWTWKQLSESGFDSLDQVELFMEVEEKCYCNLIEDAWVEDFERKPIATLKEMAEVIAAHLNS
jgi:acyl carrier protein